MYPTSTSQEARTAASRPPVSRRHTRLALAATASCIASAALFVSPAITAAAQAAPVPVHGLSQRGVIANHYIVMLKPGGGPSAQARVIRKAMGSGAVIGHRYRSALNGFAATLPPAALTQVRNDALVGYIEADKTIYANATQFSAPWGLDRIDRRSRPLNANYDYTRTGAGVTAYVIDTGIRYTHQQFGGRATSGYDAVDGGSADDCNGHGTHVAGTVGGSTYGIAKAVSLIGVRVLDCFGAGTFGGVVAGIDWVTADHAPGQPAVANMSLGGGASNVLDQAVRNSIADGVSYAVAAGNDNGSACSASPARVANALTVAATTSTDARASYSNHGSCVDLFAPGSSITSSWSTSDTATNTISGTSMATPHVAGVVALYLQGTPSATPGDVHTVINRIATINKVTDARAGSPNRLLYWQLCPGPDRISNDQLLLAGTVECVQSGDGRYRFAMQSDGNLVLYGPTGRGLWNSRTVGSAAHNVRMQSDGNLVIYRADGQSVWSSHTQGHNHAILVVQNDGNVVIYHNGHGVWSTQTHGQV
ncbi:MAG: hypothetical protein QOJ46_512 [bacterium]|jgi:subtilisin family serine protease